LLNPYPLTEKDNYAFIFTTEQKIEYLIYFADYGYMFDEYPVIREHIYTFNIEVLSGNPEIVTEDERIGLTILEVFRSFFDRIDNVVVYVCDNLDSREYARKKKFDYWFWKYNDGSIIKEDGMAIIEGQPIINSMLLHKKNAHLTEIILAFKELNERAGTK
jgi:hypothetical protein